MDHRDIFASEPAPAGLEAAERMKVPLDENLARDSASALWALEERMAVARKLHDQATGLAEPIA